MVAMGCGKSGKALSFQFFLHEGGLGLFEWRRGSFPRGSLDDEVRTGFAEADDEEGSLRKGRDTPPEREWGQLAQD